MWCLPRASAVLSPFSHTSVHATRALEEYTWSFGLALIRWQRLHLPVYNRATFISAFMDTLAHCPFMHFTFMHFTLIFHPHHAATVGGASGWHIGKARGVPPGSNAAMLAATSAAAAAAFFVTQRQIARQGRAARGTDGSGSPTAPRIGMGDPRQQQVMATMAGGGAAGAVFGAGAVRTRAAIGTCMVTGAVVGCSAEILRAQYMSWRLGQLLEERHPDIFDGSISAEDMANAAERSGFWPEWAPIQNTATPTREAILNKQIEDLKVEIMEVEDQIEVLQRDR